MGLSNNNRPSSPAGRLSDCPITVSIPADLRRRRFKRTILRSRRTNAARGRIRGGAGHRGEARRHVGETGPKVIGLSRKTLSDFDKRRGRATLGAKQKFSTMERTEMKQNKVYIVLYGNPYEGFHVQTVWTSLELAEKETERFAAKKSIRDYPIIQVRTVKSK